MLVLTYYCFFLLLCISALLNYPLKLHGPNLIIKVLDIGQCNYTYSAIKIALALAEAFNCGVNELPLSIILSWYEQKAVAILLTLFSLDIKNIYLGPTLPAFISPNVLQVLIDKFNITPISTPAKDLQTILG